MNKIKDFIQNQSPQILIHPLYSSLSPVFLVFILSFLFLLFQIHNLHPPSSSSYLFLLTLLACSRLRISYQRSPNLRNHCLSLLLKIFILPLHYLEAGLYQSFPLPLLSHCTCTACRTCTYSSLCRGEGSCFHDKNECENHL